MYNLARLGPKAAAITKFIAERAKEANASYVVMGASALIVRGVITRETKDIDVNISPRKSIEVQNAIRPYLSLSRNEGLLVDGKTAEAKAAQTKFRIFKQFEATGENMKIDISENECALNPNASTEVDGVRVATVPLMTIFKICAIARQNRAAMTEKLLLDVDDLDAAVQILRSQHLIVSDDIQTFLRRENPPLVWEKFWNIIAKTPTDPVELEQGLQAIGIQTRD